MEQLSGEQKGVFESVNNIINPQIAPASSDEENSGSSETNQAHEYEDNHKKPVSNFRKKRALKRISAFSDSDSDDVGGSSSQNKDLTVSNNAVQADKSELQSDATRSDVNKPHRFRIQNMLSDSEDSDTGEVINLKNKIIRPLNGFNNRTQDKQQSSSSGNESRKTDSENENSVKNEEQQLRMKNKKSKLKDKFKKLLTARKKDMSQSNVEVEVKKFSDNDSSNESSEGMASIEKIKQKIKERMSFKPSICDPDTSDEESNQQKSMYKQKKDRKIKLTSPKPQRMSAKQAMENMQKIKSESNRMLREKEVSLPYHRPKALSLKDIMNRRKLAVSSDGKALPIKMNEEQLKQYALILEERQKEMMELCKSESDEEESNESPYPPDVKTTTENETANEIVADITNNDKTSTDLQENDKNMAACSENGVNNVLTESTVPLKELDTESNIQLVYDDSANSLVDDSLSAETEKLVDSVVEKDIDIETSNSTIAVENTIVSDTVETEIIQEEKPRQDDSLKSIKDASDDICLRFDTEDTIIKDNTENINIFNGKPLSNDQEKSIENTETHENVDEKYLKDKSLSENEISAEIEGMELDKEFSDDDINMEDIDNIIENAEIIKDIEDKVNSQFLVRDKPLNLNPKLTGAPGMVIDLDSSDTAPRKSGIELLKERFTYFSKLKTPEEIEREREKKIKPGTQLKKLKQELEEKIAEQRSIEWAKRLEEEKQQQKELKELRGEESEEDDIDKIEATIEEKEEIKEDSEESVSEEEEPIENDIEIKDKPRKKNAMLDDEAEESECDEEKNDKAVDEIVTEETNDNNDANSDSSNEDSESESESDESSESEEEQTVTKKGRILKAFEDSDEEDAVKDQVKKIGVSDETTKKAVNDNKVVDIKESKARNESKSCSSVTSNLFSSQICSQDDHIQLAQRAVSTSDDLFTSQESNLIASEEKQQEKNVSENDETFTQTFSILETSKQNPVELDLNSSGKSVVGSTQTLDMSNIEDVAICPVTESQNRLPLLSQIPTTQMSQSQPIGEDILALCTGQFYNNQFVSQVENAVVPLPSSINYDAFDNYDSQDSQDARKEKSKEEHDINEHNKSITEIGTKETDNFVELNSTDNKENNKEKVVDDNLKSILDELADPEFDAPKPNKYFLGNDIEKEVHNANKKKKLVIDSDDETNEGDATHVKKRKKLKKRKPEKRALQISDDEDEQSELEEIEEFESDIEDGEQERLVEYDSEENEIEVKPQTPKKKKRKMAEFFENEAELTSEDEWVGSGDEDEAGLDRMEREEGDDETFHQGRLQRELGQIHMRDVLDQDKREVRLIQELLFEDGDLGGGGRQRKFKWNYMGDEETGTVPDELADTQEEEFESEEQWRKQRHERQMFLRQMQNKDEPEESLNVSVNRSTIIKANLLSKTMSTVLMEVNSSTSEKTENITSNVEKKTSKDIPSPKKPFGLLQQSYQGSLLSRGRGMLARLAALATPLAADDDAKVGTLGPTSRRNFVFAAITPEQKEPKVTKRKAESNPSTPNLVKKIRTEEKNTSRSSLLDHFKM